MERNSKEPPIMGGMTIEEAIENLENMDGDKFGEAALQLGIEALKRVEGNRSFGTTANWVLLPGEKED